jgi:hypothetical protein
MLESSAREGFMAGEARGVDEVSTRKLVKAKAGPRGAWLENVGDCTSLPQARGRSRRLDRGLVWTVAVSAVLARPRRPPPNRPSARAGGRSRWDPAGIGPAGRATAAGWESTWGGGIQVLRIREHRPLAAVGAWLRRVPRRRPTGPVWLDAVAGTRRLGGWMLEVAAGRRSPWPGITTRASAARSRSGASWGGPGGLVGVLDEAGRVRRGRREPVAARDPVSRG